MRGWSERLAVASLMGTMVWLLALMVHYGRLPGGAVSYDIYSFFYPTMVIAARTVLEGGKGLLWNPYHACGQPFFALGTTGLLYPPGVLSLFLPPDWALYGLLLFNLAVGTTGAYYLCRELDLGPAAAWCGALAFGLSNSSLDLISWTPLVSGPYAWLPGAMCFCERLLRAPRLRAAIGLAVCVAFALIPGHPQAVFYLYQLVALRVGWEVLTRWRNVSVKTLALLAFGLALPPLLVAVQFIPALEVMRAGIRNADLDLEDMSSAGYMTWKTMRDKIPWRWDIDNPFLFLPWVLGAVGIVHPKRMRLAVFYACIAVLTLVLSMGPNGVLFDYYMRLPLGTLFKYPTRFLWITSFAIAVLTAFGADHLLSAIRPSSRWPGRAVALLLLAAGIVGFARFLSPIGFRTVDRWPAGLALGAAVLGLLAPRARPLSALLLMAALVVELLVLRTPPFRRLIADSSVLFSSRPVFGALRQRLTPQDRVYLAPVQGDHALQHKTASLFRVPVLYDYEAQPTKRWASYYVRLRLGHPMTRLSDFGFVFGGYFPAGFSRRLLDLAAARYVVAAPREDRTSTIPGLGLLRLPASRDDVRVYMNTTALPRAAWVPTIEVVNDPEVLLDRLATGTDDPRQVALVEEPAPAFHGEAGEPATGTVDFETDDPEHVVLRVHAPRRGFLVLADQWFPGWRATVDGASVPIVRANYVFRLVEVPAGESVVDFRYRPRSLALGALVSALSIAGVVGLLIRTRRD